MEFVIEDKKLVKVINKEKKAKVVVPKGVEVIGEEAFNSYSYESNKILDSVVKEIVLPEGLKKIERYAFSRLEKLEKINIPSTVSEIGKAAFKDCVSLKKIAFIGDIEIIDEETFMGCSSLEEVNFYLPKKGTKKEWCDLPDFWLSPYEIRKEAFSGCTNLRKVNMEFIKKYEKGAVTLGDYAFANCVNLEWLTVFDIDIYTDWPSCGLSVFGGCKKLLYNYKLPKWVEVNKIKLFGLNFPTEFEISRFETPGEMHDVVIVKDRKINQKKWYGIEDVPDIISIDEFKKLNDREWYATDMVGYMWTEDTDNIISELKDEKLKKELENVYCEFIITGKIKNTFEDIRMLTEILDVNNYGDEEALTGGVGIYNTDKIAYILEIVDDYFSGIEKEVRYICDKCNIDFEEFKRDCNVNYCKNVCSFYWQMYSNKEELVIISKGLGKDEIHYKNFKEMN